MPFNFDLGNTWLMPEKELVLHVGFHKSGTSALQESFHIQRAELLDAGVLYPNIGKKAHHRIAWALTQRSWGWSKRGGQVTPFKVFTKLSREINRSQQEKVLLSSEFFSELTSEQIQKIASAIKGRKVKVLFTLRPLVKLLSSSYQQYLKYGTKADYEKWLHSVLDEPGVSKINPTFWKRHMHGDVVSRWAEAFGAENVTVLVVDEKRPEFLFEQVNRYLGLSENFLKSQPTGSNRSLSLEEVSLLLELNKRFPKERSWPEYLVFIRNGYIRQLTDHVPLASNSQKLPTPKWAIDQANQLATDSKRMIQQLGVRVLGDLDSLDSATVPEGQPEYSKNIDIETVAQAMLVFDSRTARKFPVGWLRAALQNRVRTMIRRTKDSDS